MIRGVEWVWTGSGASRDETVERKERLDDGG
jgi:hypothetical protein